MTVSGSPTLINSIPDRQDYYPSFNDRGRKNSGKLKNGKAFKVYRMALYSDGFNPSTMGYCKDSVVGIYMVPLSQHPSLRSSASSIHVTSLARSKEAAHKILKIVIEDIIKGTTDGFESVDAFGNEVTIFLDVVRTATRIFTRLNV